MFRTDFWVKSEGVVGRHVVPEQLVPRKYLRNIAEKVPSLAADQLESESSIAVLLLRISCD